MTARGLLQAGPSAWKPFRASRIATTAGVAVMCVAVVAGARVAAQENVEFTAKDRDIILTMSPLPPVPANPTNAVADNPRAARLGQFLFFDKRLSSNGQVACSTCHDPAKSFADGRPLSEGLGTGTRHTPSLWNVAYNRWFFWDGRADTLWAQALRPMEDPRELGGTRTGVARLIYADGPLKQAYEDIFGPLPDLSDVKRFPASARPALDDAAHPHAQAWSEMSATDQETINRIFSNVGKSLEAYERRIISRDSAFDRFVHALRAGDAATAADFPRAAQAGLKLFIGRANCRLCHSGPNFSDGEFHDTRLRTRDGGPPRDPGRYAGADEVRRDPFHAAGPFSDQRDGPGADKLEFLANSPQNWGLFKTPTLRNVAATPPYMHQGQLVALTDVLHHYSVMPDAGDTHHPERILVPLHLSESELGELLAFLESLTDASLEPDLLTQPISPFPAN